MIDRELCNQKFEYCLPWPCPACNQGTLQRGKESVRHWPAKGVAYGIDEGYLQRSDDYGVFGGTLTCSNSAWQEGVAVMGDYSSDETDYPRFEHRYTARPL